MTLDTMTEAPSLTAAEEVDLVARYRAGDRDAADVLVRAHARLLGWAVAAYGGRLDPADVWQEAVVALLACTDRFDPARGRLANLAGTAITNHLREVYPTLSRTIRGTRHADRKASEASANGEAMPPWARPPVSLSEPVDQSGDGKRTIASTLIDEQPSPLERAEVAELVEQLPAALSSLPAIDADVIRCRFLDGLTLEETGAKIARSREQARQIEHRALEKLRRRFGLKSRWATGQGWQVVSIR